MNWTLIGDFLWDVCAGFGIGSMVAHLVNWLSNRK